MSDRLCPHCKIKYPRTLEFFPPDKKRGLRSWCRECKNIRNKEYYQQNKKKILKQHKEYQKTIRGWVSRLMANIKERCNKLDNKDYKYYGSRGIKCLFTSDELYDWLSEKSIDPRGLEIHRIDNNGNYTLDNIRFLDKSTHMKLHWSQKSFTKEK